MTTEDSRFESLVELCSKLTGLKVSVRGSGKTRFVFGQTATKAFELSEHSPGYFFEVWETPDELSTDGPVLSQRVNSLPEIETLLRAWIS